MFAHTQYVYYFFRQESRSHHKYVPFRHLKLLPHLLPAIQAVLATEEEEDAENEDGAAKVMVVKN